jgi:indole-3-glycerol phosphate synthase
VRANGAGRLASVPPDTYLDEILAFHRARAAADGRDLEALVTQAAGALEPRGFASALAARATGEVAVIAEIKRRSPSKGDLDLGLDPTALAAQYESGGATCVSVLTDNRHFGGSSDDLVAARAGCGVPLLRKDFTVSVADICDARCMGADAVLLIVAALSEMELVAFCTVATELGLDALVEVHDERELGLALSVGATLIGVNQRDLTSFGVDVERAAKLAPLIPSDVVAVAESGITGRDDVRRLADAGYQAVLVGELLVRSSDRAHGVAALTGLPVSGRSPVKA